MLYITVDSAPGPDGFNGHSFKARKTLMGFFRGDTLPKGYNSTNFVLIPKTKFPDTLSDLRPTSLGNFLYKIIAKILMEKLPHSFLNKYCWNRQVFIKGRSIQENIALHMELVSDIDTRTRGGNIVVKLDMSKAYNHME